ncbi:mechanosensitive ion channel protein MscS [Halopseudomonas laoshanensis]|uniref:Mechanosensitive ion channel protein MscS n=1 Tax=Halopseudomonas laoshanensis TaxID=2268758 RepID=A0A7V7GSF8_9GAMM|nr:mechanosensitive ion channel domain-containing protein [Halopseudomonas laoshanensis]KAA0693582.1 mechanosensitive ion channel protein MscS [Halopseudomonas laoshanensis]
MAKDDPQVPLDLPAFSLEEGAEAVGGWAQAHLFTSATLIEAALLAGILLLAFLLRRLTIPRVDAMLAREALLPGLRYTLRRLLLIGTTGAAALLTWIAHGTATRIGLEGELLRIAANLLTAWVVIRLLTSLLRQPGWAKLLAAIVWFVAALAILGWLQAFRDLLNAIAFNIGDLRLSLMGFVNGILVLTIFIWMSSLLARLVDSRLVYLEGVTPAARVLIGKVLRIILYLVAVVVALTFVGVNLTALAVFSGALGIGLGFGLQKVVSNLFSGIILLLDRSLKPGDVIETSDAYGWIKHMGARYTTVATRDGKEYLIPNETLITEQVINWSYSDTAVRLKIKVGISYRSDVHKAIELMTEAALTQPRVLSDEIHTPQAHLVDFGESSVDFELRVWVSDPQQGLVNVASKIRLTIWDLFHQHDIEFPFPQRDLHIVSAEGLPGPRREADERPRPAD